MTQISTNVLPVQSIAPGSLGDGAFRYIDIASIDRENKAIVDPELIDNQDAPSRARQVVKPNDVLVSTVRPNLNAVAFVPSELNGAIASTGFTVLRPDPTKLDSSYLYHWVRTERFVGEMTRLATGASYPAVSDAIVKRSEIPLPPLDEQRRIAEVLDRADALRQKRRLAIKKLDTLLQSIFLEMFGDPESNPRGWKLSTLQECCEQIVDCPHSTPTWTSEGLICLRTSNLGLGEWNWDDTRYVSRSEFDQRTSRSSILEGDIILSREGTVGVAASVEPEMRVCMGQRLVQVRPNLSLTTTEYLLRLLLFELSPTRISRFMVGSTSKHMNVGDLRKLPIMVPDIELQMRFDVASKHIKCFRQKLQKAKDASQNLFRSMQHRAFKGELFKENG